MNEEYKPKTELAKKLLEIRKKAIAEGMELGITQEIDVHEIKVKAVTDFVKAYERHKYENHKSGTICELYPYSIRYLNGLEDKNIEN